MNPGGSIKDRAALGIVRDAQARGLIRQGGVVVEGTAGNTGIGLALVGNVLGFRTVIVMPQTQSREKIETLKAYGAEVRLVPAVPYKNPENYVHVSRRLAEELADREPGGAFWANQFDNTANYEWHRETTGPEIWEQTGGRVDGFVCAVGTGGTLAGVGQALKAHNSGVVIALSDPTGSGLYNWYAHGELKAEGSSITEGIGNGRITQNLEHAVVDHAFRIPDEESIPRVFSLMQTESDDGGRTWTTARPLGFHGSPPHLLRHSTGVLVLTYGYRQAPFGQRVAFSRDDGATWEHDWIVREDGPDGDLGYPATVELADGSLFTVCYQKAAAGEKCSLLWSRWTLPA